VRRPDFDPGSIGTGIVHLGIGAFARAHLACYTQPLLREDPGWGILGVSLRRADTRDALSPQDYLYTCAERDGAGERLSIMAALTGVLVAPEGAATVLARLADPAVRIVTLTVTEKGYRRVGASGGLDADDPVVRQDLATPEAPRTAPGLLVAALRLRRAAGVAPFTVLSCDNLPENGRSAHRVVVEFADRVDPALGRFIESEVAFPSCMVDRIVPATTDTDRVRIDAALGVEDRWPVVCEPFTQWVIEDWFPRGRPAWEASGAEMVDDVRPYEEMKLRLLNGAHSSIAYLGQLAGWETVADAVADPALTAHIAALMREVATTLHLPASVDVPAYCRALLARFANPALRHRTAQIAMDGSQKLPQRLLAPALARVSAGQDVPRIALGVAAWLRFLQGRADDGSTLRVDDPKAEVLTQAARGAANSQALCDAILAMRDVVPATLADSSVFHTEVLAALDRLATRGARATLAMMA
jgi:fructuronate reductase